MAVGTLFRSSSHTTTAFAPRAPVTLQPIWSCQCQLLARCLGLKLDFEVRQDALGMELLKNIRFGIPAPIVLDPPADFEAKPSFGAGGMQHCQAELFLFVFLSHGHLAQIQPACRRQSYRADCDKCHSTVVLEARLVGGDEMAKRRLFRAIRVFLPFRGK